MTATKPTHHEPGVYFGLDEEDYHADPALGTGDVRLCRQSPFEYWYTSAWNPKRPKAKESDALKVGSAIHKIVLEGEQAFNELYMRRPDDDDDATPADKGAATKAANKAAAAKGMELLTGDDYDRTLIAGRYIHLHPELAGAFTNGMPEVSVFFMWPVELPGGEVFKVLPVRCKCRLDYLKIKGFAEVKSIANEKRRPIAAACRYAIRDYRLDMQIAQELRGRAALSKLAMDGAVFGDHDPAWLKQVAAEKRFAGQLVFFQKSGAPLVWSRVLSPANPIIKIANDHCDQGLESFAEYMTTRGPTKEWFVVDPVSELSEDELPNMIYQD